VRGWIRALRDGVVDHERRAGGDRRGGNRTRERLYAVTLVACFVALAAGNLFAWHEADTARDRVEISEARIETDARAALAALHAERLASCLQDEQDRDRERAIGSLFPRSGLPPVPAPRDCDREANAVRDNVAKLFRLSQEPP